MVNLKGSAILESNFPPNFPLRLAQKDLRLALSLSESVHQPIPVIASANELYKVTKMQKSEAHCFSSVQ